MQTLIQFIILIGITGMMSNCDKENRDKPAGTVTDTQRPTVIYLVRHGEKQNTPGNDPELSPAGLERAKALLDFFKDKPLDALFTTPYKRTRQTLEPLAKARNLAIQEYSTKTYETLPAVINAGFAGKTVLVAGHSNTLLETIEAFEVQRPVPEIAETEYTYLFKITLQKNKAPLVEVRHYGKPDGR